MKRVIAEEVLVFVGATVLILSVVNALYLLWNNIRDRPKLIVKPVHPKTYQWFFDLPEGAYKNMATRNYGFLAYIDIINKGLRDASLESWDMFLNTVVGDSVECKPLTITAPIVPLGEMGSKSYSVLGVTRDARVRACDYISGFAYYKAEFYGNEQSNPLIKDGMATGKIVVKDILGNKANTKITFRKIPLKDAQKMIPHIETIR